MPVAQSPLLEVTALTAGFGSSQVLHGVDLAVAPGEVAGIFGLNGAGKSVTLKAIAGIVPVWSGAVRLAGRDITHLPAEQRVALGMGHVPQGRQIFPSLTVEENLRLGAYTSRRRDRRGYRARLDAVFDRFPLLADRRNQLAGRLSGGQQALLAVGRALVNEPTIVLVDEPSAGLAPAAVHDLRDILAAVAASGVAVVLVEQNVGFGLGVAHTVYLMQAGQVVHRGPAGDVDDVLLTERLGIGPVLCSAAPAGTAGRERGARRRGGAMRP